MKKLLLVAGFAVCALSFGSCKKDYTCTCVITPSGSSTGVSQAFPIKDQTKSKAKDACSDLQTQYTTAGATASCNL